MENLLEILIPLAIALIYFVGNFFGKSGDSQEGEQSSGGNRQRRERESSEESDTSARERRVQEEIRRRIMERRAARGGAQPETSQSEDQRYDPTVPEPTARDRQRREYQPRRTAEETHQPPEQTRTSQEETRETEPVFRRAESYEPPEESTFEREAREREQQIEETRKRAEELRERVQQQRAKAKQKGASEIGDLASGEILGEGPRRGLRRSHRRFPGAEADELSTYRDEVLALVRDPESARRAFLIQEVLGTPVGLRRDGKQGPLWDS